MSADFTQVTAVNTVVSETAVNQPCLIEVRMSRIDVRQLYCNKILDLMQRRQQVNALHPLSLLSSSL